VGAGGQQADADAAADPRPPLLAPADRLGDALDVADQVGVQRLTAAVRADRLAGQHEAAAAQLERIDARLAGQLLELGLADPLQVGRAERAVGPRRRGMQ